MFGTTTFNLDVFCVFGGGSQCHGDVAGDQVACNGDHGRVANGTVGENGHVGGARANVHTGHTQLSLIFSQHSQAGRQRIEQQLVHFQAASTHTLDDVFCSALSTRHDVHLGFKSHAAHADGLFHILTIDHKFLRCHQQQTLVGGDVDGTGCFHHARHIGWRDLFVFDSDHATGVQTANVAASDARIHACDFAIRHQLGFFQSLLNTLHGGIDVDHHTALQTIAWSHAHASQFQFTTWHDLGHDDHDLGRANVETDHQIFVFFCHMSNRSCLCLQSIKVFSNHLPPKC